MKLQKLFILAIPFLLASCSGVYDSNYDSYCTLVSFDEFKKNYKEYIRIALEKRENLDHYTLVKQLN